ncbi:L,D-transpeptidase family protein [Candidatus Thiodiazotropha sp. CDECU1]|uniref:L,D-transpeptidase family protein n=1 Tax=Candidatus Thiodiazotropha sp. CDECU1 TaxID=3065865 RepID=UPI00292DE256|nr:L,D-transpeptidase family protein [Candidatus Thiodiazotropha sp. CDECU1]
MRRLLLLLTLMVNGAWAAQNAELDAVLDNLGIRVEQRLQARFERVGVDYPPQRIQLIAFKESRRLELWAYQHNRWRFIHDYAIFAASGKVGPKLREGDKQVPEGFYRIVDLNPNSHFHLSMKLNYPNGFDWLNATREGRATPGSNIFIHGSAWSAGCLAIGNHYIEELFYLAAKVGLQRAAVMIVPYDFRYREIAPTHNGPSWLGELYAYLKLRLDQFPLADKAFKCAYDCREASTTKQRALP